MASVLGGDGKTEGCRVVEGLGQHVCNVQLCIEVADLKGSLANAVARHMKLDVDVFRSRRRRRPLMVDVGSPPSWYQKRIPKEQTQEANSLRHVESGETWAPTVQEETSAKPAQSSSDRACFAVAFPWSRSGKLFSSSIVARAFHLTEGRLLGIMGTRGLDTFPRPITLRVSQELITRIAGAHHRRGTVEAYR